MAKLQKDALQACKDAVTADDATDESDPEFITNETQSDEYESSQEIQSPPLPQRPKARSRQPQTVSKRIRANKPIRHQVAENLEIPSLLHAPKNMSQLKSASSSSGNRHSVTD